MNKTFRKVMCGAALIFTLTGCAKEVTYKEFYTSYTEFAKKGKEEKVEVEKFKIRGWYKDDDKKKEFNCTFDGNALNETDESKFTEEEKNALIAYAGGALAAAFSLMTEIPDAKYYAGSSVLKFEYEEKDEKTGKTEKMKFEFDKYANPTVMQSTDTLDVKVSYTYKK